MAAIFERVQYWVAEANSGDVDIKQLKELYY